MPLMGNIENEKGKGQYENFTNRVNTGLIATNGGHQPHRACLGGFGLLHYAMFHLRTRRS